MGTGVSNYTPQYPHTGQNLFDGDTGSNSLTGWELNHVGFVGNSVYYVVPVEWNPFTLAYDIGGQFNVSSGGTTKTLLSSSDPNNRSTDDMADSGTLYAIYLNSTKGTLTVWTRDLTTGHLATQLRNDTVTGGYNNWSFIINDGILYAVTTETSDGSFDVLSVDLSVPMASNAPWQLLQSYPTTSGGFSTTWVWTMDTWSLRFPPRVRLTIAASPISTLQQTRRSTMIWDRRSTSKVSFRCGSRDHDCNRIATEVCRLMVGKDSRVFVPAGLIAQHKYHG